MAPPTAPPLPQKKEMHDKEIDAISPTKSQKGIVRSNHPSLGFEKCNTAGESNLPRQKGCTDLQRVEVAVVKGWGGFTERWLSFLKGAQFRRDIGPQWCPVATMQWPGQSTASRTVSTLLLPFFIPVNTHISIPPIHPFFLPPPFPTQSDHLCLHLVCTCLGAGTSHRGGGRGTRRRAGNMSDVCAHIPSTLEATYFLTASGKHSHLQSLEGGEKRNGTVSRPSLLSLACFCRFLTDGKRGKTRTEKGDGMQKGR
mmetsp:Transcript_117367/g.204394  ORF Transcript_117367/g.204394 Transcript_117367/m.204394 type:complete len:255 (+) Transcript_117367:187-951(+)